MMTYNPEIHHRRSIRLKEYDYSRAGAYFVTVCAWKKECLFGEISQGMVICTEAGRIITDAWDKLLERYPSIELDEFVIMPNHVHGIIILNVGVGLALPNSLPETTRGTKHKQQGAASGAPTLGDIMRTFKSISTVTVNRCLDRSGIPVWQRNYYEHIVRDEQELNAIREYIRYNPLKWDEDEENIDMKRIT